MIKTIYYAHHMYKYNTKEERKELKLINKLFPNSVIINPNGWIYECGSESIIMNQCYKLVENSDILVFSTIEEGVMGKGVYTEIECALRSNKKVYLLRDTVTEFTRNDFDNIEVIYKETSSWRRYAKLII